MTIDWEMIAHLVLQPQHCQDYYSIPRDRPLALTRYQRAQLTQETAHFEGAPSVAELQSLDDKALAQEDLGAIRDYAMDQL